MGTKYKEALKKHVIHFTEQDYDAGILFGCHTDVEDNPVDGNAFYALSGIAMLQIMFSFF